MKTKSGITLAMLVLTVIIMTILVTITVINGGNSYDRAIKTGLQVEINQIEILANNYVVRNSVNDFEEVVLDISTYSDKEKAQFADETITDNKIVLYVLDLEAIDAHEVNYGAGKNGENDRYLYSKETKKVYYEKGLEVDGVVYHRIDSVEVSE